MKEHVDLNRTPTPAAKLPDTLAPICTLDAIKASFFEAQSKLNSQILSDAEMGCFTSLGKDSDPARIIWKIMYGQVAQKTIQATNLITIHWKNSGQDTELLELQRCAIKRGVKIERVFILDAKTLPESVTTSVRHSILDQIASGIYVRIIAPSKFHSYIFTAYPAKLETADFVIFDDTILYNTKVDLHSHEETHLRDPAVVSITDDEHKIGLAKDAWAEIIDLSEPVTFENIHRYLDPRASRGYK